MRDAGFSGIEEFAGEAILGQKLFDQHVKVAALGNNAGLIRYEIQVHMI